MAGDKTSQKAESFSCDLEFHLGCATAQQTVPLAISTPRRSPSYRQLARSP